MTIRSRSVWITCVLLLLWGFTGTGVAGQNFRSLVGDVQIGPAPKAGTTLKLPYITWGGDMATFYANGGLATQKGTLFDKQGLKLQLTPGDDFIQQVRDYLTGKTPFLRGTLRMMGMASEVINADSRTQGMVILQMTWSAGDHMVVRAGIKNAADLKGKTIVLQAGGPHVGMLDDILHAARLTWKDIRVVWAKDLTGSPDSPAEMFRARNDIDACFAITPDMIGLNGGLHNIGSGAEGTVKGARVLVSTAELSRSIADVYVCRKDFFDANRELVTQLVAGYLKACEEVLDLKRQYETKGSAPYMQLLKLTQQIYGKEVIPTLEEDAHGLLSDCTFVGHPGNVAFFTQPDNLHGFEKLHASALDLAVNQGYAQTRKKFLPSEMNWNAAAFMNYLTKTGVVKGERFRGEAVRKEIEALASGGALDDRTIVAFTISFEPNQMAFEAADYRTEYDRVIEMADKFGNAAVAIRGHSDPTKTILDMVKAGMAKGILKRSGASGNYHYALKGKPLDLTQTQAVTRMIMAGEFDGVSESNPRETMQAALNLSKKRAEAVRDSIITYARAKGMHFDASQVQSAGAGISEPFIAKPASMAQARQNMRVEFRLLRVTAEAVKKSDFDF
ncbi:MAG: ABC transporter substrate-binding protein [Desulfatitalea sp.]|nr:ABC transporter substrate-binding protein [Desulfatitalea sp.]NNJ99340.1 ABC transporter substrate-binding protein [Desulfatitalea sp.]